MLASFDTETRIKVLTEDRSSEKRRWGPPRYEHLVSLRNHLLAEVRDIQPDLFLSLDLECVLADYQGTWYDTAINTLGAYRGAMNAIHERESPTFMICLS